MMPPNIPRPLGLLTTIALLFLWIGCATIPKPGEVIPPEPIPDNSGEYLSPYTYYGTVAQWVEKGKMAKVGASLGQEAGEAAVSRMIPVVGGLVGRRLGRWGGRKAAIKLVGGEEFIRETSDLSFNKIDNMAVWLYATHHNQEEFKEVLNLTMSIYPDLEDRWEKALKKAPRKNKQ